MNRGYCAFRKGIVCVPLVLALTGCALTKKFKESTSVNFTPFAEQTLVLLASLNYEINPNEAYLIAPYVSAEDPVLVSLQEKVGLERNFLKGVMDYSTEIVQLSESHKPPVDQVREYASYLSGLVNKVKSQILADVQMPEEQTKAVLASVESKDSLLEAMRAAKPLIVEFNKTNLRLIREIGAARSDLAQAIHRSLDTSFHAYVEADRALRDEKSAVLNALGLVRLHRLGDAASLGRLSAVAGIRPLLPSLTDPVRIEKALGERLTLITKRQEEIERDLSDYHELKNKLDRIKASHDEMIRAGGRAILLWSQAHQKMANGVTNPAEWFGMSDAKSMLTGAAKKAVP